MNSDKFIEFIEKLRADAGKPIIVIADNASYHSSRKVQKFAKESETIHLGWLPRCAPELNPDEQVWNHAKARLGKLFIDSVELMKQNVLAIMRSIQKRRSLVQSFFQLKDTRYAFV